MHVVRVAHFLNHADHALARGRVESVGRLIQDYKFWPVDDSLCEFGELLHAEGVGSHLAITCFAQANVEESLVGALQCGFRWQPR